MSRTVHINIFIDLAPPIRSCDDVKVYHSKKQSIWSSHISYVNHIFDKYALNEYSSPQMNT